MPWVWVILGIAGLYALAKTGQAIRDFISWYLEGREFARELKRRREQKLSRHNAPALKERSDRHR